MFNVDYYYYAGYILTTYHSRTRYYTWRDGGDAIKMGKFPLIFLHTMSCYTC